MFYFRGADTTFPLLAFVFLVALGIDYNICWPKKHRDPYARVRGVLNVLRHRTRSQVLSSNHHRLADSFKRTFVLLLFICR